MHGILEFGRLFRDDVIFNLERWCERDVEGTSMAARFATLIDNESGKLADGIVERIDEHTVKLVLPTRDIEGAKKLMADAGATDTEFELISIDDARGKNTCDAVAAQCREAGFNIKRTVLPGSTFWNDWTKYPYSATNWNGRPLGVQVLALT